MLHISICDDELTQQALLTDWVKEWGALEKTELSVNCFDTADQFLFQWEEKRNTDILLLDIEMPGMDGMQLARKIREEGENLQIIFVTGMSEYVYEGYDVNAVSFLIKPVKKERLHDCLTKAVKQMGLEEPMLVVQSLGEVSKIRIRDISYLESEAHDTVIYLGSTSVRSKEGIHRLEVEIGKKSNAFFKLHRSYLVSLPHIQKITKKDVWMDTGDILPIARGKWEGLNQAYLSYYRR